MVIDTCQGENAGMSISEQHSANQAAHKRSLISAMRVR